MATVRKAKFHAATLSSLCDLHNIAHIYMGKHSFRNIALIFRKMIQFSYITHNHCQLLFLLGTIC